MGLKLEGFLHFISSQETPRTNAALPLTLFPDSLALPTWLLWHLDKGMLKGVLSVSGLWSQMVLPSLGDGRSTDPGTAAPPNKASFSGPFIHFVFAVPFVCFVLLRKVCGTAKATLELAIS